MNKKIFFGLAVGVLTAGLILPGCDDSARHDERDQKKVENAKEEVREAEQDLKAAEREAQETIQKANETDRIANKSDEWKSFRADAIAKIHNNEVRIAEMRDKMKTSGKNMDKVYAKKIDKLEERNNELRKEIEQYQEQPSNWDTWSAEWNRDMDELGNALNDLFTRDKK